MNGEWADTEFLGAARYVCVRLASSCGRGVLAAWRFLESCELTWHESTWGGGLGCRRGGRRPWWRGGSGRLGGPVQGVGGRTGRFPALLV